MFRSKRQLSLFLASLLPSVGLAFSASKRSPGCAVCHPRDNTETRKRCLVVATASSNDDWWMDDERSSNDKSKKLDVSNNDPNNEASPFLKGEELKQLRSDLEYYRENLKWAEVTDDKSRVASLRKEIEEQEKKDPEAVYNKARKLIAEAETVSRAVLKPDLKKKLIDHWSKQKTLAQACLPRFQMEGLWVGNYGGGPQLVNITYADDTLVATKVTGDDTVPRGEVSFTANLSPPPLNATEESDAASEYTSSSPPVSEEHTILQSKYGESIFPGQGQLAKKNFQDAKFISGVFIVYDAHRFSFSWVPTKHHVFFVRPSPHETIRLLRDVLSQEDEVDNMRYHLSRCFEIDMTTSIAREHQRGDDDDDSVDTFKRIHRQKELEMLNDMSREGDQGSVFKFWRANKWRKYIDRVLGMDDDLQ
ncbi:F-box protein 31 [Seminavis robusta]|uniref:F-box protein 31 n=1 Tax=Seminavis robusta TaxID=568900 RepID=A0A9N8DSG0_9STRA|nr:F-box protein 31 [Seminavis robusta]|eukprot:Sro249_g098580.1 F-box protein 31 (420) ;mRNA; r:11495-12853